MSMTPQTPPTDRPLTAGDLPWLKPMAEALDGYEADYGEGLDDMHELGRIDESRATPSFRIRVGHVRALAKIVRRPAASDEGVVVKAICQHCQRATVVPPETLALAHPAPATADKLRVAVEALEKIAFTHDGKDGLSLHECVSSARQALAALNEQPQ